MTPRGSGRIGCALLAAGGSTRLGRPKQLVSIGGKPLVLHVFEQLQAAACDCYAAVLGSSAEAVSEALGTAPCAHLNNPAWAEGIASSIRVAVGWARAEQCTGLVLAACDQPKLTAAHVRALCDVHARHAATVASGYAGTCGIPALFDASWYTRLEALHGDRGAGALLRTDASVIVVPWPEGAVDIDTPGDVSVLSE